MYYRDRSRQVADPSGVDPDPDPTFIKRAEPIVKKKNTDPDLTVENYPDRQSYMQCIYCVKNELLNS